MIDESAVPSPSSSRSAVASEACVERRNASTATLSWPVTAIADAIAERGFWVGNDLLTPATIAALRSGAVQLLDAHGAAGGVVRLAGNLVAPTIRGDRIAWIGAGAPAPLGDWLERLEGLATGLRDELRLPLHSVECMTACYPPGAGYRRHVDRHRGSTERLLTCIAYLNPAWQDGDGGELTIWADEADEEAAIRIAPRGGRVVIMRSDLPHAVARARRPRYSLTAWLRRD